MRGQNAGDSEDQVYRQRLTLWFGLLFSVVMYFAVITTVPASDAAENPTLVNGLLLMAIGLIAASFFLKGRFAGPGERGTDRPGNSAPTHFIPLVLCEAAALEGVVVHFVTGSPTAPYFLLLGVAGMLFHYPKRVG